MKNLLLVAATLTLGITAQAKPQGKSKICAGWGLGICIDYTGEPEQGENIKMRNGRGSCEVRDTVDVEKMYTGYKCNKRSLKLCQKKLGQYFNAGIGTDGGCYAVGG